MMPVDSHVCGRDAVGLDVAVADQLTLLHGIRAVEVVPLASERLPTLSYHVARGV